MKMRNGLMVALVVLCAFGSAWAEGLPEAGVLAGWGATEWADAAEQQAQVIRNEVDREEVRTHVLMALCQVPGQQQRVARLADAVTERLEARGGDPMEVDYQLPLVVYAQARIGDMAKARQAQAMIGNSMEQIAGLLQMGWGTGERNDHEATLGVIADIELRLNAIEDEYERSWYEADLPLLLWLIGEHDAAVARVEAIELDDARVDAWLLLGELALDFGDEAMAQTCLDHAREVMATLDDGGLWQTGSVASLTARLGQPAEAGAMMIRLPYAFDQVMVGGEVARAFAEAGNDESAQRMLDQMRDLAATVRPEPDFMEALDIAYLWSDVAEAAHDCGRMDLVAQAWEEAKTPLNRGMIAAGIAVEIAWADWLVQRAAD